MKETLPLPPCPCPVCGQVHPHFSSSSPLAIHGAGRPTSCISQSPYAMHMTPDEMDTMIYGPMWQKIYPNRRCRVVSAHPHQGLYRGMSGFGDETKKKLIPILAIVAFLALIGTFTS